MPTDGGQSDSNLYEKTAVAMKPRLPVPLGSGCYRLKEYHSILVAMIGNQVRLGEILKLETNRNWQ